MLAAHRRAAVIEWLITMLMMSASAGSYLPNPEFGYSVGFLPDCPGVLKNSSISPRTLEYLQIAIHRVTSAGQIVRRMLPIERAIKVVTTDKEIDLKNKKTMVYTVGFADSSMFPLSQAIGTAYSKRGYNVFILDSLALLIQFYPKSVRLSRAVGRKLGEFLVQLSQEGLPSNKLELVGISLGAHVAGHAAKYFYSVTGMKPSRITGLDPAGPCYRALHSEDKLWRTDAETVDVIHTNVDGFGIAEPLGHIDIYVNGGEFQPGDIPYIPCLIICSHIRSVIYWWQALENPKKFIAAKCDSIQNARLGDCLNNSVTNYMGLEAKFNKPGIYYLQTSNEFPYYMGRDGVKAGDNIFIKKIKEANADDDFVV